MTIEQTAKLIRTIAAAYPNYRSQYNPEAQKDAIDVWSVIFQNDDYKLVSAALYSYISRSHEFAPSPGQVKEIMYQMTHPDELTEAEAWSTVFQAIKRKGGYDPEGAYASLPETVQRAVGSAMYLHELAISENVNWSVEQSLFTKRYREIMEQQRNMDVLPSNVRIYIDKVAEPKPQLTDAQKEEAEQTRQLAERVRRTIEAFHAGEDRDTAETEMIEAVDDTENFKSNSRVGFTERLNRIRSPQMLEDFHIPEEVQQYANETGINLTEIPRETIKAMDLSGDWKNSMEMLIEFYYPQARAST